MLLTLNSQRSLTGTSFHLTTLTGTESHKPQKECGGLCECSQGPDQVLPDPSLLQPADPHALGIHLRECPGYDAMFDLGNRGNDALYNVHGKFYEVGCIPCVLYTAAGTSLDWALGVAGIPYVYSIELRDTGSYGFLLPADQIIPTAEEAWAWHEVAARQIIEEFGEGM